MITEIITQFDSRSESRRKLYKSTTLAELPRGGPLGGAVAPRSRRRCGSSTIGWPWAQAARPAWRTPGDGQLALA